MHDAPAGFRREPVEVIVPNLNWRYSGVTAANRAIAPLLARRCAVAWLGPHAPDGVRGIGFFELLRDLRSAGRGSRVAIWHARRNIEMIAGVALKALGLPIALVFTSAAQRRHTWITRWLIARMDAVIAPSEAAAAYLSRPARVVAHGVDTDRYKPPDDRHAAFAESGLPGRYAIGAFGRVRPQKGTDVFVEAMCRLLPRYPDFTAVVVGRTDDETFAARLRARVAAAGLAGRVRFLGELPIGEVPRWFGRLTLYAFTSRNEGFGLTLLEAMASGVGLVAARAGAAEKVVTDGETGIMVPPGDADALAAALEPLMREPALAEAMGRRARERAVAHFSLGAETEGILAVYDEVWRASVARAAA
jgi:mannosyltransferase